MGLTITTQELLARHTTLHLGGVAEYFCEIASREELREAIRFAREKGLSWRVIGGGSNILVPDNGLSGLTMKMGVTGRVVREEGAEILLSCGAGEVFDEVVSYTCTQGWWGLENLSAIPGSVGGTPIQNVGAYGSEVANVVRDVTVYDVANDTFKVLPGSECHFSYRHSLFKEPLGAQYVVVEVTFALSRFPAPQLTYRDLAAFFATTDPATLTPALVRDAVCAIRSKKFPDWRVLGTAGSFFKNPIIPLTHAMRLKERFPMLPVFDVSDTFRKISLGWILDHVCHMRGVREGHVGTFEGQALVVVAYAGATAREVEMFAEKIATCVLKETDIAIEWEVTKVV